MQKDEDYAEENDLTYEEIDECHHYDKLDVSLKDIDTVSKRPHGRLLEQRQCLLFQGYDSSRLAQDTLQWRNKFSSDFINDIKLDTFKENM